MMKRILIIGPSNIGDAILMSEVVGVIHRRFPDAHLTLAVGTRARALFVNDPRIQTLVDTDQFDSWSGRLHLMLVFWRYHPQLVIDLRHTVYPLLLNPLIAWRYLRQPPWHLVHMRDRQLWKLHAQVPQMTKVLDEDEATSVTVPTSGMALSHGLWASAKDHTHIDGLWRRWDLNASQPLILICPGARSHIKRWMPEGFARVADRLIAERRVQVVFSGEPDEESVVREVLTLMTHRAHSAVGLTTIRQLGVLMRRAHLVVTNDSASLHLASALQVPTVAIFGPTDANKYGPTATRHRTIRRRLFCTPCEQALCRFNHECMRFITAEEVFAAASELLGQGVAERGQGTTERDSSPT